VFTRAPSLFPTLRHINPFHISHSMYLKTVEIFFHLCLDLPSGVFPEDFPTNILYDILLRNISLHVTFSCRGRLLTSCLLTRTEGDRFPNRRDGFSEYSQFPSASGGRLLHPQPEDAPGRSAFYLFVCGLHNDTFSSWTAQRQING
jgi:hypothetical protein